MSQRLQRSLAEIFTLRWNPGLDLLVVAVSWLLVTGSLYTATVIVGAEAGGGLPYFFLYGVLAATLFGVGIPLAWMVAIRKRPLSDLGISARWMGLSLALQIIFAAGLYFGGLAGAEVPAFENFVPLLALALAIGFFEALFWRGWVLLRLEEAFGLLPAILLGSALYAVYHIGYAMPLSEVVFLFFIGLMYAAVFRLTRSIFILWPFFQPMGQLITLMKDGLTLPLLSALGFAEVLIAMIVLVYLAARYTRRHRLEPAYQS